MSEDFTPVTNKSARRGEKQLRLHESSPGGYLTAAAVREYFDDGETVTLAVDQEHSRIGIQPGSDGAGDAYTLTKSDWDNATIALKTALREIDIDQDCLNETWRFDLQPDGDYIVADLKPLVEHHVGAVHCDECGRRFKSDGALKSHYTSTHDDPKEALADADPDDVGEAFPGGESA